MYILMKRTKFDTILFITTPIPQYIKSAKIITTGLSDLFTKLGTHWLITNINISSIGGLGKKKLITKK